MGQQIQLIYDTNPVKIREKSDVIQKSFVSGS